MEPLHKPLIHNMQIAIIIKIKDKRMRHTYYSKSQNIF